MKYFIEKWKDLPTLDRTIVGLCLVGVVISSVLLLNDDLLNVFDGENLSKPVVGNVSYILNDTRHRSSNSFAWLSAKNKQNIRLGDSLFTGDDSQSQVALKAGGEINLGQNTLVVFQKDSKLMDFGFGNFRLAVNGEMTLSIRGKVTKIKGKKSDIQFIVPKNKKEKPQVRLLRGEATLEVQDEKAMSLTPEIVDSLDIFSDRNYRDEIADLEDFEDSPVEPKPDLRNLQLYDIYELNGKNNLVKRTNVPSEIHSYPVIEKAPLLRLSQNNSGSANSSQFIIQILGDKKYQGYVVEYSRDFNFSIEKTKVKWVQRTRLVLNLKSPGSVFYRIRGVNQKTEISHFSNVVEAILPKIETPIVKTPIAKKEKVKKAKLVRKVEPIKIKKTKQKRAIKPTVVQQSHDSEFEDNEVVEELLHDRKPLPIRRPVSSVNKPVMQSSITSDDLDQPTNDLYRNSRISLETGTFTVFSPDESDVGRENPFAYSVGLRAKHWFNRKHGFEGIARVKAGNMNETAEGINPLQLEARYHYLIDGSWLGRTNLSVISGLEVYRNIGQGYFSQKYSLGKLGLSLDFPVGNHWDMGGDLLVGMGADQTIKYQALGRMCYYFHRRYAFGAGYRFYVLEAGSDDSAPLELPYKETYGEGFLFFRWFY